jgi:hypothetical protein
MSYDSGQSQQSSYRKSKSSSPRLLSSFPNSPRRPPYSIPLPRSERALSQQKKISRRWLWILGGGVGILIIAAVLVARYLTALAGPVVTVDNYYQAVLQKNYTLAYSYLASNATLTSQNQKVPIGPQKDYVTSASLLDSNIGPVTKYTVATTNDTTLLLIDTVRSKNAHPIHYSVRFTMVQVDGTWKIKDMNGGF